MRTDFKIAILLALASIPAGVALMSAPEYISILKEYPGLFFWSGLIVATALIVAAIIIAVRGEASGPRRGHGRRMIALVGMVVCGAGFLVFAGVYFWPESAALEPTAQIRPVPSRPARPPAQTTIPFRAPAEEPLPSNAKFRYRGKVFWATPRRYTKDEANDMRAALREVYDCINAKSAPIVSSWDGPAVMFTRDWLSPVQTEGPQSAIAKLNDIRSKVISAHTELQEITSRRPYYRQDIMTIINDHGEVGEMNGALNDYMDTLRKLPDKPTPDLIKLAIGPSEARV